MVINDIQKNKIKELAEEYNIDMMLLFGSQTTGKTHSQSDVDIAYTSKIGLNLEGESRLIVALMEIFRRQDIDLVNLSKSSPLLKKQIVDTALVLYEKHSSLFNEFFLYATRVFVESKVLLDIRKHYIAHRLLQTK